MHYYQFNIGDYRKDTGHLTPIEHYIYRTLIDWYYLDEKPIPNETHSVLRRLCLGSENEKNLLNVLSDFFDLTENEWHHARIDSEISAYHANVEKNRRNGKLGGRPSKTQSVILANPTESQKKPNQELITNKPINNKQYKPPIPAELYSDYMKVRKAKKAGELTETAFNGIVREAEKAGISIEDAIKQCCERGWVGFKADWIKQEAVKNESQAWRTDDVLMMQKAKELGVSTTGKSRFEVIAAIDKKRGAV